MHIYYDDELFSFLQNWTEFEKLVTFSQTSHFDIINIG